VKYSKDELIRLYKKEINIKVKERMLLVIKVEHDNVIPAYAAEMNYIEVDHGHHTG
jgi:hypothetical protein